MENYPKTIKIWINGKKISEVVEITINSSINSLRRLKDTISNHINVKLVEKMRIFNHKGLDLDDSDLDNLINGQVLYVSDSKILNKIDKNFNNVNYIHEYEFIKSIKSGGYGTVYLAKNLINNEIMAIKKVNLTNLPQEECYNINREALYLESLKHKNIIRFKDSFIYENEFYNVMDYAKGGELGAYISEKKVLAENDTKRIFIQIHDAIKYIHSKNVIHRDIKPNNILFLDENRENIVLIDFGISGFHSGNIKDNIKAGTIKYIPPEVASGTSFISNPKIDMWALGIILYLMVYGNHPFDGKDNEIIDKIINKKHIFPQKIEVSKSCKNLINKLLEKDSNKRIEVYDSLFDEWYSDSNSKDEAIYIKDIENEIMNGMKIKNYSNSYHSQNKSIIGFNNNISKGGNLNINRLSNLPKDRNTIRSKTSIFGEQIMNENRKKENNSLLKSSTLSEKEKEENKINKNK